MTRPQEGGRIRRVLILGPTSRPLAVMLEEVRADLAPLARPGLELVYRTTGAGPAHVRTTADERAAAPHVVRAARVAAVDGFDAVVVDCTGDPGVAACRGAVAIPVIGAGAALRAALATAASPVQVVSGDELRSTASWRPADGVATVAVDATGWSHVVAELRAWRPGLTVLDPLDVAIESCLAALDERPR